MDTKRVELSNEQWAVVRRIATVRDTVNVRTAANARGFEDTYLNALVGVRSRVVEWSFGEVTDEAMLDLPTEDAMALMSAASGMEEDATDPLASSSAGTTTKTRKARPSNG